MKGEYRLLPIGTKTKWGRIAAVFFKGNERYYMMAKRGVVSLMPATVVER